MRALLERIGLTHKAVSITRYRSNLKREWIRLVDRKIGALECPFAQQSFEFKSALLTQLLGNQI